MKNQRGFTLMEIMVALGITSFLVVVIMNAQKSSEKSVMNIKRNLEINEVIQYLTSELSKDENCIANFYGRPIANTYTSLVNKQGTDILKTGAYNPETFGAGAGKSNLNIVSIATVAGTGDKMNLRVTYQQMTKKWEASTAQEVFEIPINVFLKGTVINSCYSDLQSALVSAVKGACQGEGAVYLDDDPVNYPYGHCEHKVALVDSLNNEITPAGGNFSCPAGEVLKNIDTTTTPGRMTFQCSKVGVTSACPAWSYLRGINADGSPNCVDIRTLFPDSGFMVVRGGQVVVQTLDCNVYGANRVLQKINTDGSLVCINPRLSANCGVNQYATGGVNPDGSITCGYAGDGACASGYIKAVDATGTVTCANGLIGGGCTGGEVMNGIDSSGNATCVPNP